MNDRLVMIVEDNPNNMKLARDVLELHEFTVCCAVDANEALKKIAEALPKVILMDIQLPDIDGLTLTKKIKENSAYAHIPIIAMTAYAMKGDREKILAAGCNDYVAKPADIFDVIKLIEKYIPLTNDF